MQLRASLFCCVVWVAGCSEVASTSTITVQSVVPRVVDPLGHSRVTVHGAGFLGVTEVAFGGVVASQLAIVSDTELLVTTALLPVGASYPARVTRGNTSAILDDAITVWSPAELPDARLYDALSGIVGTSQNGRSYEWAKLTPELHPDWLWRDGNTLDWLPATGRFWMVAGWNPEAPPRGFDYVDPNLGLVPHGTTNEVWSSPDGITWQRELADDHPGFDRRHAHNMTRWRDRLWMIGGDWWRQAYNHDVVSSANGVDWRIEVAQTPWADRVLQVSGAYNDRLWMVGGQTGHGLEVDYVYHNDVWSSSDGVTWTEILPDGPASQTRWAPRGMLSNLIEWHGRMWLVGGGTYAETLPRAMYPEVWSTTDGVTWQQHTAPPWVERQWHNVVVFDDRLWVLMGYSEHGGNLSDAWYSDDGETWTQLPSPSAIAPGSHAQGVAVGPDFLLYAGGNYSYGTGATNDKSTWRLRAFRGVETEAWEPRGTGKAVTAMAGARPIWDRDALGAGLAGLQFDSTALMALPEPELQPHGRSVFWVGRSPEMPEPFDWDAEPVINPQTTVVGDSDGQACAAGYAGHDLYYTSANAAGWQHVRPAGDVRRNVSEVKLVGFTHGSSGELRAYRDGVALGEPIDVGYSELHGWSRIGGGSGDAPSTRLVGTLGAVIILPYVADAATIAQLHAWAQGRFGAP